MAKIKQISNKIKTLRRWLNIKQSDLAESIGVSHRHYQKIESGEIDFKISFLSKLSEALSIPSCYIHNSEESELSRIGVNCQGDVLDMISYPIMIGSQEGEIIYKNLSFTTTFGNKVKLISDLGLDILNQSKLNTFITHPTSEVVTISTNTHPKIEVKRIKNSFSKKTGFIFLFS